ncbi:MAG: hypothetical protein ACRC32_05210 [Chroococcidiopsis sp.]
MSNLSLEEIKAILFQLPEQELVTLVTDLEERLQTTAMMHLAETGFQEWEDEEEDIYNAEA